MRAVGARQALPVRGAAEAIGQAGEGRLEAWIEAQGALEVRPCVLLDKPDKRVAEIEADYVGFVSPDRFVVGYGLDYAHYYRELPFIGVLGGD